MDNQDKIFNRFKEAADHAETKDFPGMEKVWSRLEDKLDRKEDKKSISLWKKIAVAASFLLVVSLGYQFLKTDKKEIIETPKVVVNENQETVKNPDLEKSKDPISSNSQLVPKEEAVKILDKQIKEQKNVAVQEIQTAPNVVSSPPVVTESANYDAIMAAPAPMRAEEAKDEEIIPSKSKAMAEPSMSYAKKASRESFGSTAEKQAMAPRKSAPLVILNGNAMSHSDDDKRDKMIQSELNNLKPENVDSLVVLDSPLYIIDGIYYSENDLFGTNPTSPYAPLNEQDIKTITILQDSEATEKYGDKGKKGVVIITTKTGKPAQKK